MGKRKDWQICPVHRVVYHKNQQCPRCLDDVLNKDG